MIAAATWSTLHGMPRQRPKSSRSGQCLRGFDVDACKEGRLTRGWIYWYDEILLRSKQMGLSMSDWVGREMSGNGDGLAFG
jgi:hypothetical protein